MTETLPAPVIPQTDAATTSWWSSHVAAATIRRGSFGFRALATA